ncbi:hypothetical protein EDC01DRAFT_786975 [Geopyxis carbonaria]|nr:hypothetical protein EDC01DRAFT_786975 [Geopyxis carbonaria]
MKFTATALLLVASLSALVAAQAPPPAPIGNRWKLRVTSWRMAIPAFSGWLDVRSGYAGFNWDPNYKGFVSSVSPLPKGQLRSDKGYGYLQPVKSIPGLYDLKFSPAGIPKIAGVLSTSFFPSVSVCGNVCNGNSLLYDTTPKDAKVVGLWVVYAKPNKAYALRWWSRETQMPAGHYPAYLWREKI